MADAASIRREVDVLEQVQRELAVIASREDNARRKDMVDARRRLAEQIARVGAVAEPHFAANPSTLRDYRALFSAMRSAAALHQANWPAVMLGERPDDYAASVAGVRLANRDFVAWVRAALRRRPDD